MPEEQAQSNLFHIWRPIPAAGIHMKGMEKLSYINTGNLSMTNYFTIELKLNPIHSKMYLLQGPSGLFFPESRK